MGVPAVDTVVLERLLTSVGPVGDGPMMALLDVYRAQGEVLLDRMDRAVREHDLDAVRVAAHSLKGASATLGAQAVAERCACLENGEVAPHELTAALSALTVEQQRSCSEIQVVMARRATTEVCPPPGGGP